MSNNVARRKPKPKAVNWAAFKKGEKRHPDSGRKKGSKNKLPLEMAQAMRDAAVLLGTGDLMQYWVDYAMQFPETFGRLLVSITPPSIKVDVSASVEHRHTFTVEEIQAKLKAKNIAVKTIDLPPDEFVSDRVPTIYQNGNGNVKLDS